MKTALTVLLAAATLTAAPGVVNAKGCIAGAAVGGVAGHFAGHHPIIGAVGGCLVGRHLAKQKAKQRALVAHQQAAGYRP